MAPSIPAVTLSTLPLPAAHRTVAATQCNECPERGQWSMRRGTPSRRGLNRSRGCSSVCTTIVTMYAMSLPITDLAVIPVLDVRDGGPVRHATDAAARARALRDGCRDWLAPPARMLLPVLDALTRRWLRRSRTPYRTDAESIAAARDFGGICFLNGSYEWACTALPR